MGGDHGASPPTPAPQLTMPAAAQPAATLPAGSVLLLLLLLLLLHGHGLGHRHHHCRSHVRWVAARHAVAPLLLRGLRAVVLPATAALAVLRVVGIPLDGWVPIELLGPLSTNGSTETGAAAAA